MAHDGVLWQRLLIGWATIVLLLLVAPLPATELSWLGERLGVFGSLADELGHLALFAVFACLAHRVLDERGLRAPLTLALVSTVGYGALTEAMQMAAPTRAATWSDLIADATGGLVYALVVGLRRTPVG